MKLLPLLLLLLPVARAAVLRLEWTIANGLVAPDGVQKLVPLVNGQYPGPPLRGRVGDRVIVVVTNRLPSDTTSIHWHGIKQTGTPFSDGVPGISQCPIGPGESFTYDFVLDAPGTLWWHSHTALQKSSLYGAIIVDGDERIVGNYPEFTLLLNDWYHASGDSQIAGLSAVPFRWVGDAQSLLINGRGDFNCSATNRTCDPDSPEKGPAVFDVKPDTTYRLRIIGASSLAFINLNIDGHELQLIETETTILKPFKTRFLDVGAGQSYSALLHTKPRAELAATEHNNGLFWIQTNVRHRPTGERGLAILRYSVNDGSSEPVREPPLPPGREDVEWSLRHARHFRALTPSPLPRPSRVLTILGTQNSVPDGRLVWAMNNMSYTEPSTPLLHAMALDIRSEERKFVAVPDIPIVYDYNRTLSEEGLSKIAKEGTHVLPFEKDEVVDFVFQNARNLGGVDEIHPWHLHMHNFWQLAFGEEHEPWSEEDEAGYDTTTAVFRNTFSLYPGSWTAIRVKFDNPGMAHFHCHILPHLIMGMGFVMQVGDADDLPPPPQGTQFCGIVTRLMAPPVRNPLISGGCSSRG